MLPALWAVTTWELVLAFTGERAARCEGLPCLLRGSGVSPGALSAAHRKGGLREAAKRATCVACAWQRKKLPCGRARGSPPADHRAPGRIHCGKLARSGIGDLPIRTD